MVVFIPGNIGEDVVRHPCEGVETHYVQGAEGGAFGPPDQPPGQLVDLVHAIVLLQHHVNELLEGKGADAVGHEVGSVLGNHDTLAQALVAKLADGLNDRIQGLRRGNQFQQLEIARRIEEMGSQPVPAKIVAQPLPKAGYRNPGGVGADDRSWPSDAIQVLEQADLEVKVFRDSFNDPIHRSEPVPVILQIPKLNAPGVLRKKKSRRFASFRPAQSLLHQPLPDLGVGLLPSLGLFLGSEIRRRDIQQTDGKAGVDQVGGNGRAHHVHEEFSNLRALEEFTIAFEGQSQFPRMVGN